MKSIERITLEALENRIETKKAKTIATKAAKETDYIDDELKDIAEKMNEDGPLFFAVAEKGKEVGLW